MPFTVMSSGLQAVFTPKEERSFPGNRLRKKRQKRMQERVEKQLNRKNQLRERLRRNRQLKKSNVLMQRLRHERRKTLRKNLSGRPLMTIPSSNAHARIPSKSHALPSSTRRDTKMNRQLIFRKYQFQSLPYALLNRQLLTIVVATSTSTG